MTLSDLSIKRPVFAWILMFGLIFFGILSFRQMGINENPDVDYPRVSVRYAYDGAPPEVIEKDIIEPVENVLVSLAGIRNLSSTAQRGNARIDLEFDLDRNIDFAVQEVQTLLGRAQRSLPENLDSPVVTKQNASDEAIMYASIFSENLTQRELMILFRDRVSDQLTTVDGVSEIRAFGYHEPLLRIELDAKKLKKYQLTAQDIVQSIQSGHDELPAGKFETAENELLIRVMGEADGAEEFGNMIISRRGGQPNFVKLKLKDVANIFDGTENTRRLSRINGKPAMGMAIYKQNGVNAVETADLFKKRIAEVNQNLQPEAGMMINFDRTQFIRESVNELVFTLILSAILTSLVCWVFLGSFSATSNILLAIPTSIIGTFIIINALGFTLNTFSILGLALAIGVVVDDAIIMLENISRYMQMGFSRINAAFKGSREITFAVIATSLALISIFIPITFMKGIEGRFFWEFAITISIAVALSSLEALTLAPMRCSQFLRIEPRKTFFGRRFERGITVLTSLYGRGLNWSLNNRLLVVGLSSLILVSLYFTYRALPTEFAPPQDRGVLFLIFQTKDGKSLEFTSERISQFEKIALAHPDVQRTFVAVGGFGAGGQSNRGNGVVVLKPAKERDKNMSDIAEELRAAAKGIDNLTVRVRDRFGGAIGGRRGNPIEFTVNGPEEKVRKDLFFQFQKEMEAAGQFKGIKSDDIRTLPEVQIIPDRELARQHGVEVSEIARILNLTYGGSTVAQYTKNSRRFDVFVQLAEDQRSTEENMKDILVRNNRGQLVALTKVVKFMNNSGPETVFREDRIRGLRVNSDLAKGASQGGAIKTVKEIAAKILPEKYYLRFSETPEEKLADIAIIMLLGLIISYMILASQFNSFSDPLIVFLAVPFGLAGAAYALYLGSQSLNVYSAIGILLTLGIVMKNSILLVEFTNQLRDEGKTLNQALLEACPIRLRPILMTTCATLAAAVPPALALGPGAETRIPMALTIIGGVSVSTFFTLFIVPCVFSLLSPGRRVVPVETNELNAIPETKLKKTNRSA